MNEGSQAKTTEKRVPVEDLAELRSFLLDLLRDRPNDEAADLVIELVAQLQRENHRLLAAIRELRRGRAGGGSERIGREQLHLFLREAAQEAAADNDPGDQPVDEAAALADEDAEHADEDAAHADEPPAREPEKPPKRKPRRRSLPEQFPHLPIERKVIQVPGDPGDGRVVLGQDVSHVLELRPASMFIIEIVRERVVFPDGHIETAPAEARPLPAGIPGFELLTDLIVCKWGVHLPVHRVLAKWRRLGVEVPVSTAYGWGTQAGQLVGPVADAIRRRAIVEAAVTHADDTGLRVLDRDAEDGSVLGHMWVTLGDQRFVAFHATKDWTAGEMKAFLGARTSGWLVCDGYAGYDQLVRDSNGVLRLAGCWAHARRYFVRAKEKGDSRAREVLALIGELYAVEAEADAGGDTPERRRTRRQAQARPILDRLEKLLRKLAPKAVPKSHMGKAITYLSNQWAELTAFLEDGRLPLDNNAAERALRAVAIGRKNWLFCGSFEHAALSANLFTVVATAALHGVNLRDYFVWLLRQLARREWSVEAAAADLLPERFAALVAAEQAEEQSA